MPTLHYKGKSFLGFDSHVNHIGIYPYGGYEDGSQVFVVNGKVSSGNPWEVMHASLPSVMDMRKSVVTIYIYDGQGKITELRQNNDRQEYTGKHGKPEALLPSLRESLGTKIRDLNYALEE